MPVSIPVLPHSFFEKMERLTFPELALEVARHLLENEIPDDELRKIVEHTIQFDAPVVAIEPGVFSLELFHGPTLAFKDFGARFLSGLLGYFARQQSGEIVILVATSGDTGSAVANGFFQVPGTRVVVLYPSGKVSDIQEKQFTTLGHNITALEIDGTFDDCQALVKTAFHDTEVSQKLVLTSANSINIARLIPQSFYYFWAVARLKSKFADFVFSVPSGNLGNVTAGLLAKRMGLPIREFIVATNANDILPAFLDAGEFNPRASVQTISNAMDVGNPSNFYRVVDLYQNDLKALQQDVKGYSFTDEETREAMRDVYKRAGYVLDPHGAVGYLGLKRAMQDPKKRFSAGIFLETAHPGKFGEVVEATLQEKIILPDRLEQFLKQKKSSVPMSNRYEDFKSYLLG